MDRSFSSLLSSFFFVFFYLLGGWVWDMGRRRRRRRRRLGRVYMLEVVNGVVSLIDHRHNRGGRTSSSGSLLDEDFGLL
jgi:hypothetical protein